MFLSMLVVFVAMVLTLAAAGLVVAYVAFIQRGKDIPRAEWLTDRMHKASDRVNEYVEGRRVTSHE